MKKPNSVKTDERIFQITTYSDEIFLCNVGDLEVSDLEQIYRVRHYWNFDFKPFGKKDLKEMILLEAKKLKR